MPLTAKEKMKRYRARLKQDQEKADLIKQKDRDRKFLKKMAMTSDEKLMERRKNRERVEKHREKLKATTKRTCTTPVKHTPAQIKTPNFLAYKSPQMLGKAKQKVMASLPSSPRRRTAVIASLATDVGLQAKEPRTSALVNDSGNRCIDVATKELVIDFFLKTSWMCPGQKDTVIIRLPGKKKETVQKQYMLTTIREAHAVFKDENPDADISFSKFADLRPPQVQLQRDVPHNCCLCKYHENIRLLLQSLSKAGLQLPTGFRDFIALLVCDQNEEDCMAGQCANCPGLAQLTPPATIANQDISWQQWSTDGKTTRIVLQGTVQDCFDVLKSQTPYFLLHTFVKRTQADEFQRERESVKDDPDKVVIQVDFAENYTTKLQGEIQSAYWAYNQVTVFTVCAWDKEGVHSMTIVSDYLHHDKYAVNVFLNTIFKWLDEEVRQFESIVIFSDGAASQFKQRYLLCSLTLMNRQITWNFFATSHGKGPVDGVGGTVKRIVAKEVMSGGGDVLTSQQFAEVSKRKCPNITVLHVSKDDIEKEIPKLDEAVKEIRPVPKTQQMHRVTVNGPYSLEIQNHAKAPSDMHKFKKDNIYDSGVGADGSQTTTDGGSVGNGSDGDDGSSVDDGNDSDDGNGVGNGSDGDDGRSVDDGSDSDDGSRVGNGSDGDDGSSVDDGSDSDDGSGVGNGNEKDLDWKWVLIQYSKDKNAKQFIGQVIETDGDDVTVKFVKKTAFQKYVWPEEEDTDRVNRTRIIRILDEPQMDRRAALTFT